MKQQEMARWLKLLILFTIVICAFLAFGVVPNVASNLAGTSVQYAHLRLPFQIYIWISLIPLALAVYQGWKIVTDIGNDLSFTMQNADRLKRISVYSTILSIYYFAALIALFFLQLLTLKIIVPIVLVVFICLCFAVIAAMLSHLVRKAAQIKEENDLTV